MFTINQGFSINPGSMASQQLNDDADALLSKCFELAPIANKRSVEAALLASDDPVGEAGRFYGKLNVELMFEFMPTKIDHEVNIFEMLVDRGVNMVDACLQNIKLPLLSVSETLHLIPGLTMTALVKSDRDGLVTLRDPIARLDQIYAKVLDLACFAPDLDARRGLPRVYPGQHLGIPLNDPKARAFALVLNTPNPLPYIANSALMQDCMAHWFDELQGVEGAYPHLAIEGLLNRFNRAHTDLLRRMAFYTDDRNGNEFGIDRLLITVAKRISQLDLRQDIPPYRALDFEQLLLPLGDAVALETQLETQSSTLFQVASNIIASGSYLESRRILQSFFTSPESFVRLLVDQEMESDRAFSLFAHALGDYLGKSRFTPDCADLQGKIDWYREVFQAAGYPDLKGTHALDTLCMDIEHGEYFHARGYLRTEEMNLGSGFCSRGFNSPFSGLQAETMARRERKVAFALAMGQIEMLLPSAIHLLDRSKPKGVDKDYEIPSLIMTLLNRSLVTPSQIIFSKTAFKTAMTMGCSAHLLLDDPKVADIMRHSLDDILEDELGL
ncbi:hypothetical protein RBE51_17805 [Pseudomonas taiwanensis]|uniref:hypothetical protein n=1 Tax=Pseudomonas taiwanensis TaxID=470150 RepID=UPI0028DEACC5|nr:hypothetical protein [Pseudomonas taiwanensis]MDT8924666.1 hypothetical protein [Pseudomonas taiwanensis]